MMIMKIHQLQPAGNDNNRAFYFTMSEPKIPQVVFVNYTKIYYPQVLRLLNCKMLRQFLNYLAVFHLMILPVYKRM